MSLKERLLGGPSWEESVWSWRLHNLRHNWRCVLLGHDLIEKEDYEDIYHVATHRECRRGCEFWEEIWNVHDEGGER